MFVHLYDTRCENFNLGEIVSYLSERLPDLKIDTRCEFVRHHLKGDDLSTIASELASIKVIKPDQSFKPSTPLYGEIEYERRVLSGASGGGVLYDGFELKEIYQHLLPADECNMKHIHIAFTNRLIGTFDENDLRYHARVVICSMPSIISTTGMVEAPAKPKEFYIQKGLHSSDAHALADVKKKFKGEFIDYDDPRITEVVKGYTMQALFYLLMGEAFCKEKECRLFNAHWQKDLIRAQFSSNEFCKHHENMLREY